MKIKYLFFILLTVVSLKCSNSENKSHLDSTDIKIKLSSDSTVEFYPLPDYALSILKSDSLSQEQYENLFAVYAEAKDESIRDLQEPVQGNYYITDTSIIFKPHVAFKKNQKYIATCYIKKLLVEPTNIIRSQKLPGKDKSVELHFEGGNIKNSD
ncbi:MAG: hypothetical protein JWQ25_286 [Daejeonella sp.]|nr:hypothetical protein [Daejeonella sp.]